MTSLPVTLVTLLLLAVTPAWTGKFDIGCAVWGDKGMYDLRPLAKGYDLWKHKTRENEYHQISEIGLKFNLCKVLTNPCGKADIETPATIGNGSSCAPIIQPIDPKFEDDVSITFCFFGAFFNFPSNARSGRGSNCDNEI